MTLLVAARGAGPPGAYSVRVRNVALPLLPKENKKILTIGKTDYWIFDANVGDVIKLRSAAPTFASSIGLLNPYGFEMGSVSSSPDEYSTSMDYFIQIPGQYIVSVSCIGHGGGGEYSISRESVAAKSLKVGAESAGTLKLGDVHVWTLSLKPGDPLLIKWISDSWDYGFQAWTDKGDAYRFDLVNTAADTRHAILSVSEPTTLIFVLTQREAVANYRLAVSRLSSRRP
jgi:hypothetical protein